MSGSPVWDVERMRPVVLEWDAALRADLPAYARLVPEAEKRGSVLRPPVTGEAVAAAEVRLGVRLPPSYRSFLLIADGAEAGGFSANRVMRLSSSHRAETLSAQDVVAFADDETLAWLVGMWRDTLREYVDRQVLPSADAPVQVYDFEPGARALLVTRPVQDGIVGCRSPAISIITRATPAGASPIALTAYGQRSRTAARWPKSGTWPTTATRAPSKLPVARCSTRGTRTIKN